MLHLLTVSAQIQFEGGFRMVKDVGNKLKAFSEICCVPGTRYRKVCRECNAVNQCESAD